MSVRGMKFFRWNNFGWRERAEQAEPRWSSLHARHRSADSKFTV